MGATAPEATCQTGLPAAGGIELVYALSVVQRHRGRLDIVSVLLRELLRDQETILGLYDASVTALDPFPQSAAPRGHRPHPGGHSIASSPGLSIRRLRHTLGVRNPPDLPLAKFRGL
jgi:hypothetical protein